MLLSVLGRTARATLADANVTRQLRRCQQPLIALSHTVLCPELYLC